MILLTCAVAAELAFLAPRPGIELLVTGVGPIEAAASVSRALAQSNYELVVSAGIAGGFDGCAAIGEGVAVAEDSYELDLEDGARIALPDGAEVVDRVSSDFTLIDRLAERGVRGVRAVTVGRVTASERTAQRLAAGGVSVETMEGFAVLRAAEIAGIPAIEVRGVSNRVGERARSAWNFEQGVRGLEHVLDTLFATIGLDGK